MKKESIIGYGVYIPRYRIKFEEMRKAWPDKELLRNTGVVLGVPEKTVPRFDEDSITMGVEAAKKAIRMGGIEPSEVGALILGTICPVYWGKPCSDLVAKALGCGDNVVTMDIQQSSRSGVCALTVAKNLVGCKEIKYALAIGSDCVTSEPGSDPMEPLMGAGAAAFLFGNGDGIAKIGEQTNFVNETFDIWSKPHEDLLSVNIEQYRFHYLRAVTASVKDLFKLKGISPTDYQHVVLQQPSAREPSAVARELGFKAEQMAAGHVVSHTGDVFSASTLIGLARVLDLAKEGDKILLACYGAGSSTALHIEAVGRPVESEDRVLVDDFLEDKIYVDYVTYLKYSGLLRQREMTETMPTLIEVLTENPLRYRLIGWKCKNCGFVETVAIKICHRCHSQDFEEILLPEIGRIEIYQPQQYSPISIALENKQETLMLCIVDLGDERKVATQLVDYEGFEIRDGIEVEVVFRKYKSSPVNVYGCKFRPVLRRKRRGE